MVTLPDPNSLPHFQWIDETGRTQPLHAGNLREIRDYVINSNEWASEGTTVNSVLTRATFDRECEVCGKTRDACEGQPCIDYFQNTIAVLGKRMCDIKGAGDLGKGVFANRRIPNGSILGEYLGKLYPLGTPGAPNDRYVFLINEIAEVSALEYGNLTRFFNHHCHRNIRARLGMYGKRQVVLYQAARDIEAGEQLFVDYGTLYFSLPGNPCKCDAQDGDHLPGKFNLQASTRNTAEAGNAGASPNPAQTHPASKPTTKSSQKHSQENPAAVLNNLTRSAGVSRRYGPQVYTCYLGRKLKKQ